MIMKLSEIGQVVRANRKALGFSQQTLAERAHVSRFTLIKLENGSASDIQLKTLAAILAELRLKLTVSEIPVSGVQILGEDQ